MELTVVQIPIIDIFAGPGGLGEGFSALDRAVDSPYFRIALSIEKDPVAHQTLELRAFLRQFKHGLAPDDYYEFLRGDRSERGRQELFRKFPAQAKAAKDHAWHAELGTPEVDALLDERISRAISGHDKWVLIGGPPCQAYSIIGRARNTRQKEKAAGDVRNILYTEYLNIVARHRPAVFVMENVKGILTSRVNGQGIFEQIIADLEEPSAGTQYRIFSIVKPCQDAKHAPGDFIVECERYGIPQARHRVILIGIRKDLAEKATPGILAPSPEATVEDVIAGLPAVRSGLTKKKDNQDIWQELVRGGSNLPWLKSIGDKRVAERLEEIFSGAEAPAHGRGGEFISCMADVRDDMAGWYIDPRLKGVCNHTTRAHMIEDLYRYAYVSCFGEQNNRSPLLKEYPIDLLPDHLNVDTGHFDDRFRVQLFGKQSTTITSHMSKDGHYFIHPDPRQVRSLTVREAARLQTFPDNYFFCGTRTQQYVQVGNAVPPLLAYKIAGIIKEFLENA